ncbi:MAG: translation initiation factor IF-3, partial [Deltaproteobacteria bacterium]|nr:translation initiation factor IF-3 [Deltaproteobacteria bacterium]
MVIAKRSHGRGREREPKVRTNRMIRANEIRVVADDGGQLGVMSSDDAIALAEDKGLDLVEISATSKPPVCRIMDYGRYKYQMSKKAHEAKKKQTIIHVKEIKFKIKIEKHDYDFKVRNILKFLG